jgi:hypothetical protein
MVDMVSNYLLSRGYKILNRCWFFYNYLNDFPLISRIALAYFLGKMVKKASINVKKAQIHNDSTLHCGFNWEIELNGLKGILDLFTIPFFIRSCEPYGNPLNK